MHIKAYRRLAQTKLMMNVRIVDNSCTIFIRILSVYQRQLDRLSLNLSDPI